MGIRFKFNDYHNSVGTRVDSEGNPISFAKMDSFDLQEKIDNGAKINTISNEQSVPIKNEELEPAELQENKIENEKKEAILKKLKTATKQSIRSIKKSGFKNLPHFDNYARRIKQSIVESKALSDEVRLEIEKECSYKTREVQMVWQEKKAKGTYSPVKPKTVIEQKPADANGETPSVNNDAEVETEKLNDSLDDENAIGEMLENVDPKELKNAKKILGNKIRDELKKAIDEKQLENAEGVPNGEGQQFADADVFFIGSIVAKKLFEDPKVRYEILKAKKEGNEWVPDESFITEINKIIQETFKTGEIHRAVYLCYLDKRITTIFKTDKKIKKRIEAWCKANGLDELSADEMRDLENEIMQDFKKNHRKMENSFVILRTQERFNAHLNGVVRKKINKIIKDYILGKFIIETKDAINNTDRDNGDGAENPEAGEVEVEGIDPVEKEKNKAEDKEIRTQQELFEDNVIKAIHEIHEIVADDLDIDFIPTEKHYVGNIKEKMEQLLNKSGQLDENIKSGEIEQYRKELADLNEIAKEILELKNTGKVCIVHDGNTFFIERKQETPLQELELIAKDVVGQQNIRALIEGIRMEYDEYVLKYLKSNPQWERITYEKQNELLQEAIICFADEVMSDNGLDVENEVKEKIYRYAFEILNK